jgi:hypothetical protein
MLSVWNEGLFPFWTFLYPLFNVHNSNRPLPLRQPCALSPTRPLSSPPRPLIGNAAGGGGSRYCRRLGRISVSSHVTALDGESTALEISLDHPTFEESKLLLRAVGYFICPRNKSAKRTIDDIKVIELGLGYR